MLETTYNIGLVALSYAVSVIGSFVALKSVRRGINLESQRWVPMLTAAVALGGVGVWAMHFIGMLALSIENTPVLYDITITLLSLLVVVVVVFVGLLILRKGNPGFLKLTLVGIIAAAGVVGMHYSGMLAMRMNANMVWDMNLVIASVVIAIAASIVALALAMYLTKTWQMIISALVMGVAVNGMHYTGMSAASFTYSDNGVVVKNLIFENFTFAMVVGAVSLVLLFVFLMFEFITISNSKPLTAA